jgi:hypothetical protein
MIMANVHPDSFKQDQFHCVILKPDGAHFYTVFGSTIGLGFCGMILSLLLAETMQG